MAEPATTATSETGLNGWNGTKCLNGLNAFSILKSVENRILSLLNRALRLRCPRCGIGELYEKPFRMRANCERCDLKFEREQGYFVGAIYVNYAATVAIAIPGFFILDSWGGWTIEQQLALWIPFAVIFPLLFFHHSRSLWLALDHYFNPPQGLYRVSRKG